MKTFLFLIEKRSNVLIFVFFLNMFFLILRNLRFQTDPRLRQPSRVWPAPHPISSLGNFKTITNQTTLET